MIVENLNDEYLELVVDMAIISINDLKFGSNEFYIYLSGLVYGIWISICDIDLIELEDLNKYILDKIKRRLN
jgi:hypothetical protein